VKRFNGRSFNCLVVRCGYIDEGSYALRFPEDSLTDISTTTSFPEFLLAGATSSPGRHLRDSSPSDTQPTAVAAEQVPAGFPAAGPTVPAVVGTRETTIQNAAKCIVLLKAEGRLEEAENLEKLLKAQMAQIDRNQSLESKTILHLQEMDKTVTMIGEHLSAGILKGGAVDHQELSKSIPFLDKCIPLLKSQIQMVEPVLPEISAAEQAKYAKIIDSAKKSIQLMQSLIELHERELFSYVQSL